MIKQYQTYKDLALAIYRRDIRQNALGAALSSFFCGRLKVTVEVSAGIGAPSYTYLKRPGWAVIHVGLITAILAAGLNPSAKPDPKTVEKDARRIKIGIEALAYHEVGHLLASDMTGDAYSIITGKYKPFEEFIKQGANVIEDPAMERNVSKNRYFKALKKYYMWLVKRLFVPEAKKYKDDGKLDGFLNYLLLYLRVGPHILKGHNAMFDTLRPKGIETKLREAYRDPDPKARLRKQLEFFMWVIDELNLQPQQTSSVSYVERPIIIVIDKQPGSQRPKQTPLQPQINSLPPVTIVEAGDEEDEEESEEENEGEQPDADVIDLRKNKKGSKSKKKDKSSKSKNSSTDEESEDESEEDASDKEASEEDASDEEESEGESKGAPKEKEKKSKPKRNSSKDEENESEDEGYDENDDLDDDEGEWDDEGDDEGEWDDEGEDEGETEDSDYGEDEEGEDTEKSESNSHQAGHSQGAQSQQGDTEPTFDWEIGDEDPLDIAAMEGLETILDTDLENALDTDAKAGSGETYLAKDTYDITEPNEVRDAFNTCTQKIAPISAGLITALEELKAESAPMTIHRLEDGEEVSVEDYIDARMSGDSALDVFTKEVEGREITDLAVSLLVDCSGSMAGQESQIAYATSCLVAIACEEVKIPTEISAFSTNGVLVLKEFEDDESVIAERIGMLNDQLTGAYDANDSNTIYLWGGTDCTSALAQVLGRIRKYDERACKLVFVITDGDTGTPQTTGELVRQAREEDIVVIGIGVGTSVGNLRRCFQHCASFNYGSLARLPEYVAHEIREAMGTEGFEGY